MDDRDRLFAITRKGNLADLAERFLDGEFSLFAALLSRWISILNM
jgi:hypothetical protein